MHAMFPDWMRSISPEEDVSVMPLTAWWDAVVEFVAIADVDTIVDLCRAAYQRPAPAFDMSWRQHVKNHDPLFPQRDRERQIAVLAGAALIHAADTEPFVEVAIYARRCASKAGWEPALPDVILTDAQLRDAAARERELPEWPPVRKAAVGTRHLVEHIPDADEFVTGASLKAVTSALAASVSEALSRSATNTRKVAASRESVLLEQSDTLVWLLAGHSSSQGLPWKQVSPLTAAVCAALELRNLSKFVLGRPDAPALIQQAVESASTLAEADFSQLAALLGEHVLASSAIDLTPLCVKIITGDPFEVSPTDAAELGIDLHDELGLVNSLGNLSL